VRRSQKPTSIYFPNNAKVYRHGSHDVTIAGHQASLLFKIYTVPTPMKPKLVLFINNGGNGVYGAIAYRNNCQANSIMGNALINFF
jgi:hypothetical protein